MYVNTRKDETRNKVICYKVEVVFMEDKNVEDTFKII